MITNGKLTISHTKYEIIIMSQDVDHFIENMNDSDHFKRFQDVISITKEARFIGQKGKFYYALNSKENTITIMPFESDRLRIKTCYIANKRKDLFETIMEGENLKTKKNKDIGNIPDTGKTYKIYDPSIARIAIDEKSIWLIEEGIVPQKDIEDIFINPKCVKRVK